MNYYETKDVMLSFCYGIIFTFVLLTLFVGYETSIYNVNNDNNIQAAHNRIDYNIVNNSVILHNASLSRTTGLSMQPTIFTGNKAIEVEYTNQILREGQIITFKNGNSSTIHRIKGIYKEYILTQGDNNQVHEKVFYDDIENVVIGVLYN